MMRAAVGETSLKRWTLVATILGSGMVFLDGTVVTVALERIGRELPSTYVGVLEGQSFVYNGYLLTLSALLILAGALNDYYGRRRMFAIGLVGFGVTSVMCGLAPTMELLIFFRVLQGAAGALLVPGSLSIITASFQGEEQGRAFGIWAGASAATTILGPIAGGALVDSISWRAAFFINIPLALIALWATARLSESRDEEATGRFDWLGSAVVALAFPFLMARSANPLVPLHLFRSHNFTVTNLSTLVIYGALYVLLLFSTIFFQGTLGYNAFAAGLASVPAVLFLAIFSSRFGALAGRYGPRWFMATGPAIMTLGALWLTRVPAESPAWQAELGDLASWLPPSGYLVDILPGIVLFGIGLVVMVAPLTTCLMTSIPVRHSGLASAINNAISRVGPQLAGALIFVMVTATFYGGLQARVDAVDFSSPEVRAQVPPLNRPAENLSPQVKAAARTESTEAFHLAMLVAAVLLVSGAAINGIWIRNPTPAEVPPTVPDQALA
jgi:MFS family permease